LPSTGQYLKSEGRWWHFPALRLRQIAVTYKDQPAHEQSGGFTSAIAVPTVNQNPRPEDAVVTSAFRVRGGKIKKISRSGIS
jgi:hypothetical protein